MSLEQLPSSRVEGPAVLTDVNEGISADVESAVAAVDGLRYMGFSCRESAGTPAIATFRIINGITVAGGTSLDIVELAANESTREWYGPDGMDASNGLTIDVIAGTIDVLIRHKTV